MSLSTMTWCPPWYLPLSMLGMLVFPLVAIPPLRRRDVSLSAAPILIGLIPLFHGALLAYLGLRSVFLGMTLSGTDSRVALSAGFGEAQSVLVFSAVVSAVVLVLAIVIARRRTAPIGGPISLLTGRRAATVIRIFGAVLVVGIFAITVTAMNTTGEIRKLLYHVVIAGTWLSGALVLVTILTSTWVISRVRREAPSPGAHASVGPLAVALAFVVGTGAASWFVRAWLIGVAIAG